MKRAGAVLLVLAVAIQFAVGASLFASHEQWTRTCSEHSEHVCNEVSSHDSDRCAICFVSATGPGTVEIDSPQLIAAATPLIVSVDPTPVPVRDCDCSCPRGPPAPLA